MAAKPATDFQRELESLINRHSMENGSNTPDFLLASFLASVLVAYNEAVNSRDEWYGVKMTPGLGVQPVRKSLTGGTGDTPVGHGG